MAGALNSPLGLSMAISSRTLPLAIWFFGFHVVEDGVDSPHVVDGVDFGADQSFQSWADDRGEVGVHPLVTDGVDTHVAGGRAGGFFAAQRCADIFARRVLFIGRNPVFDIEHDRVGVEAQGFVDHFLPMSRHEHPRAD